MEQKEKSLKWQRNLAQTVKAIKKQPQTIEDLEDKGIKRREAYRCLEVLKDIDLIEESKGEYIWKSGLEEFNDGAEYKIKLKHCKNLARPAIKKESNKFNVDMDKFRDHYNFDYFIQHLRTGYPDIYKLWKRVEKDDSDFEKVFSVLYQKINEIALETGVSVPEKLYQRKEIALIPSNIFYSLENYLNFFLDKVYDPIRVTWTPGHRYSVYRKEFIENCIRSEDIKKHHSELIEINKKTEKDYASFNIEIKLVIIKVVEDGETLKGNCVRCPKITIGKGS